VADDLRWKAMTAITGVASSRHAHA
jgi:hypothetical protein